MSGADRPLHILIVPFPTPGHTGPMLQLAQALASRSSNGCLVTFVNSEYNQKLYEEGEGAVATSRTDMLRMVGLSDGLPLDAPRSSPEALTKVIQGLPIHMKPQLEQLLDTLDASPEPVSCIIGDLFLPWLHSLACSSIAPPLIGFCVISVAQFAVIYSLPRLIASGQISSLNGQIISSKLDSKARVSVLPGLLDLEGRNLHWISGDLQEDADLFQFLMSLQKQMPRFRGMLFNSFTELEGKFVDALVEESGMTLLTLGPLLLQNEEVAAPKIDSKDGDPEDARENDSRRECWEWLKAKEEGSVLYISFGTTARLSRDELQELALGIEAAGVPFLWVMRADLVRGGEVGGSLPEGFVERTKERAFFMPWAPQILVLSHPSVGAFLTHGGWNSVLESMSMGVPMLTWSYLLDHKATSELIVERWKIGLALRDQEAVMSREKVKKLVSCLLHKGSALGAQIRERAADVKRAARRAFGEGGSSHDSFRKLLQFLSAGVSSQNLTS